MAMTRDTTDSTANMQSALLVTELRYRIAEGMDWLIALLSTIGDWRLPEEDVGGCHYRYLIGGEAFDWLLLAERLCASIDDLVPTAGRGMLPLRGGVPGYVGETDFRRLIGYAKYRAHLNFVYGVLVEQALQVAVAAEIKKEHLSSIWKTGHKTDDEVCQRIYGAVRRDLQERWQREQRIKGQARPLTDMREFTYWLFKYRLRTCDPARVASDTRKGLSVFNHFGPPTTTTT